MWLSCGASDPKVCLSPDLPLLGMSNDEGYVDTVCMYVVSVLAPRL